MSEIRWYPAGMKAPQAVLLSLLDTCGAAGNEKHGTKLSSLCSVPGNCGTRETPQNTQNIFWHQKISRRGRAERNRLKVLVNLGVVGINIFVLGSVPNEILECVVKICRGFSLFRLKQEQSYFTQDGYLLLKYDTSYDYEKISITLPFPKS